MKVGNQHTFFSQDPSLLAAGLIKEEGVKMEADQLVPPQQPPQLVGGESAVVEEMSQSMEEKEMDEELVSGISFSLGNNSSC